MRRGHKDRKKKPKKGNMERRRQGRGEGGGGREKDIKGEMGVKCENVHFINEIREGEGQVLLISKCKQTKTSSYVLLIYFLLK